MSLPFLPKILPRSSEDRKSEFERRLLRAEAEIGGKIFGPLPKGRKRQFFCLDENTWIWHESWTEKGVHQSVTTRYDVRPTGVIKTQDGQPPQRLTTSEARNLYKAAELYFQRIDSNYQHMLAA